MCSVSDSVCFVCLFFVNYLAQSSWNYSTSQHTSCVCLCVHSEEFYCLYQSILMAKETKYFVMTLCFCNVFGEILFIDVSTHYNSVIYYL
jgi:hypothetical protein